MRVRDAAFASPAPFNPRVAGYCMGQSLKPAFRRQPSFLALCRISPACDTLTYPTGLSWGTEHAWRSFFERRQERMRLPSKRPNHLCLLKNARSATICHPRSGPRGMSATTLGKKQQGNGRHEQTRRRECAYPAGGGGDGGRRRRSRSRIPPASIPASHDFSCLRYGIGQSPKTRISPTAPFPCPVLHFADE